MKALELAELHKIHKNIFFKWMIALRNDNQECLAWYGDGMKLLESLMPDVPPVPTLWERFVIWWRG